MSEGELRALGGARGGAPRHLRVPRQHVGSVRPGRPHPAHARPQGRPRLAGLVLRRAGGILFRELKGKETRVTNHQKRWQELLEHGRRRCRDLAAEGRDIDPRDVWGVDERSVMPTLRQPWVRFGSKRSSIRRSRCCRTAMSNVDRVPAAGIATAAPLDVPECRAGRGGDRPAQSPGAGTRRLAPGCATGWLSGCPRLADLAAPSETAKSPPKSPRTARDPSAKRAGSVREDSSYAREDNR